MRSRPFGVSPERLLREDEPEAFAISRSPLRKRDESREEEIEQPEEGASREDVDLVRMYLQHIGKRRLLKAHEEVAIGQRIETAQRDLVAALARDSGGRADACRACRPHSQPRPIRRRS